MANPMLLPEPKSVQLQDGAFPVDDDVPVIIAPGSDQELNAAWSFAGEAEERLDMSLPVERMGKLDGIGHRILFLIAGRDNSLYPQLSSAADGLDRAPAAVRDQAYVLEVTPDQVLAVADTPQGLYYAAQTLRQLLTNDGDIPCCTITDWPTYRYRGVMLDISRFRVPTLDSLFERIERLAALKINVFQLYTEHTFASRRHPEMGANCGSMTAEDIITLDEVCKPHFVDLNANLQSFGHHKHLLSLPDYNDLAEIPEKPWTLCPTDERIYELLDDLYAECLPAYSSPLFNASCDETWELGNGRSAEMAEKVGVGRVYLDHIKRINELAQKYDKRMMIWADIVLKHPELIPEVPDDIVMLDWSYHAESDLSGLQKIADAGLEHWTCPGVSSWQQIFCDVGNACGNISRRAVAGEESGATGLLNTDWGDNGHAQSPAVSYHGYAFGAEQSWTPNAEVEADDFDRRFAWAWFGDDSGDFGRLYRTTGLLAEGSWKKRVAPFSIYWDRFPCEESLEKLQPSQIETMLERAREAIETVSTLSEKYPEHRPVLREHLFGLGQILFIEKKVALSAELLELGEEGMKKPPVDVKKKIKALLDEWNTQKGEFTDLWLETSRRSEIDYRLGMYRDRAEDYEQFLT